MLVTSVCSSRECTHSTVLYGSTTAVATWGQDHTVKLSLLFLPESTLKRSSIKHPRPEPVPPPQALKTMKPWRPVQLSASLEAVQDQVHDLLADGVVATGEVVRGILLTGDQLLRVEQLTVRTRADLVNDRRLQVDEDAARHVLAG